MLEDGLKDVASLEDSEEKEERDASDVVRNNYLKIINNVSFSDLAIYTVELPISQHGTPEVKDAKMAEVSNLLDYNVFEEVKDEGQETIGSRWVVTAKEKHNGQKQKIKVRLIARGFQETFKP